MASGTNSTIASPQDNLTMKDTKSKSTQPPLTLIQRMSLPPLSTCRSEAHQQLLKQVAQEAHTEKETPIQEHFTIKQTVTHAVATLCLYKPW